MLRHFALPTLVAAACFAVGGISRAQEQYPFEYDVLGTSPNFQPIDLALSAPIGVNITWANHFLFVVDAATNELQRYWLTPDGELASPKPDIWFSDPTGTLRPVAVALDDNTASLTFGYVHLAVEDLNTGTWTVITYDSTGFAGLFNVDSNGWQDIVALAVDKHGDLYVADAALGRTYRYANLWFSANWSTAQVIAASTNYVPYAAVPTDVTVTDSDLVLVADSQGNLMASHRLGPDLFNRNLTVPYVGHKSIDAHDQSERLWMVDRTFGGFSSFAERWWYRSSYANNGFPNQLDGLTMTSNGGQLAMPVRVEFARFFDSLGPMQPRCSERVFVCDPGGNRVASYEVVQVTRPPTPLAAAWWKFDELGATVLDSSGNGNTGLFAPFTPAERQEGLVKNGLVFKDNNDGVRVPTSPSTNVGTGSFTIDCWVRTTDTRSVRDIADKRLMAGPNALAGYALYLNNGYLSFQIAANSQWWNVSSAPNPAGFVADGLFHYLAVVVDRTPSSPNFNTLAFWVDGQQVGANIAISPLVFGNLDNNRPLLIGRHPTYGDSWSLAGEVDELALYKFTLTPLQMVKIFKDRGAGKP
jgi:hypothetical protein